MLPKRVISLTAISFALTFQALGQAKKPKPTHDPFGQLFRYAPMPKATRSIVIPLGNIQFAFDTENLRAHTVWRGKLDLYGPQYVNAKRPFIAQPNGQLLWGNPPTLPWRTRPPGAKFTLEGDQPKGKFTGTTTDGKSVTLRYTLQLETGETVAVQLHPSNSSRGLQRALTITQCKSPLWFLANSFQNGTAKRAVTVDGIDGLAVQVTSTPLSYIEPIITEAGAETIYDTQTIETVAEQHWVLVPPHKGEATFIITTHHDEHLAALPKNAASPLAKIGEVGQAEFKPRAGPRSAYYKTEYLPLPPGLDLLVTGMDWLGDGRLAVCTWPGEVYLLDGLLDDAGPVMLNRLAKGLNEPMGLLVRDGRLYVSQKPELTEIAFDEKTSRTKFTRVSADWGYSGHYNAFSYGPVLDRDGRFVLANAGHSGRWDMKFMGWAIRRASNGTMDGVASGFREPNGIGVFGPERDVFVTDNQGHWTAVCELNHLRPGKYFGRPSSTPDSKKLYEGRGTFTPPAIWFPYSLARSISGMAEIRDNRFGPFKGQLLVGDFQNALVTRVFLEKVNGEYQGAVFSFITGFRSGVNRLSFGPDGNLYVGGLQRTWTSIAPDPASLERVTFTGSTPFSIRKVEAKPDGFLLTFTEPANPSAADPDNFDVSQFRYTYHSDYGSPRFNHAGEKDSQTPVEVTDATLSANRLELRLLLSEWREGHVTQVRCFDVISETGKDLWHDTFHYTLNQIPKP